MGLISKYLIGTEYGPERKYTAEDWKRLGYRVTKDGEPITEGMYMRGDKVCYNWAEKANNAKLAAEERKEAVAAAKERLREKQEQTRIEAEAAAELEAENRTEVTVLTPAGMSTDPIKTYAWIVAHDALACFCLLLQRQSKQTVTYHARITDALTIARQRILVSAAAVNSVDVRLDTLPVVICRALVKARTARRPLIR